VKKRVSFLCVLLVVFGFSSNVFGEASCTSSSIEALGPCPYWITALDRNSTDTHTTERLIVELNACQISEYEVCTMEQDSTEGFLADLEQDDIFVVWDEDADHGSKKYFTFSGIYVEEEPAYVQVSSTNNNIINWQVYRVTSSGTLTITDTGHNEHDSFHLRGNLLDFAKTDDLASNDCAGPGDELTYTLCWDNTGESTFENAYIVDYLPAGVDYDWLESVVPLVADPNYNQGEHTYTWELGTIAPDDSGCVSLAVTVNEKAEPGMYLRNVARLWADPNLLVARAPENTPVCCWGDDPNIIYVDVSAEGSNTGINWQNAYSGQDGLQRAITRATDSTCEGPFSIYVAEGTYRPGDNTSDSFRLPEGSRVYGGFMTGGSDVSNRNPDLYKTVLTGYTFIDDDPNATTNYELNDTVVTMIDEVASDANFPVDENTLLDGFTITDAVEYGIYGTGVDFTIVNCTVTDSGLQGIYAADCDVAVKWSKIKNNGWHGIEHIGEGNKITVENSKTRLSKN